MVALLFTLILLTALLASPATSPTSGPNHFGIAITQRPSFTPETVLPSRLDVALRMWFDEETDGEQVSTGLGPCLESPASDPAHSWRCRLALSAAAMSEQPHAPLVYTLCNILR